MFATPAHRSNKPLNTEDVPARDAVGRPRLVSTYRRSDHVVLVAPPGEAAILRPADARTLADRLYEYADAISAASTGRVLRFPRR